MENKKQKKRKCQSSSFIDRFVELLPEIHIKGYSYCGPNTDLEIRLARGEPGVNDLDCACKEHDIAYAESRALKMRYNADKILILKAIGRVIAKDSRAGERFSALIVSVLIAIKVIVSKIELYIGHTLRNCLPLKTKKKSNGTQCQTD